MTWLFSFIELWSFGFWLILIATVGFALGSCEPEDNDGPEAGVSFTGLAVFGVIYAIAYHSELGAWGWKL